MFRLVVALSVLCLVSGELVEDDDRVVNGRTSSINEFPHQVSIQQDGRHFCGGSILNARWILTAGHCMEPVIIANGIHKLLMRLGSSSWTSGGVLKRAESAVCHERYNARTMEYDVALIKTVEQIVFSAVIKPVKILRTPLQSGTSVTVSGWGQMHNNNPNLPQILQSVAMAFMSRNDCAKFHRNALYDSMICGIGPGIDSCRGDSGGPLIVTNSNPAVQVGVVSWGIECALAGLPGAYADLTNKIIVAFIERYIGKLI